MFKLNLLVIVGFIVLATHAKIRLPTPEDGCGKLSTSKTRIVGGTAAKNGEDTSTEFWSEFKTELLFF